MIKVWRFEDAPKYLQALSTHGGDEDWLALMPKNYWRRVGGYIAWLNDCGPFGCASVKRYPYKEFFVFIGAHA